MKVATVAAITLVMRAALVAQVVEVPASGVIFGTALYSNGRPASGIGLTALGSGQALSGRLPRVKTDNEGKYRFEHLLLGTYVVQADDEQAGYSIVVTTEPNGPRVQLTAVQPVAELKIALPPPAGFLHIHLTNRRTGAVVSSMEVDLTLADASRSRLYGTNCASERAVLIPPGVPVLLHVAAPGFYEWAQGAGTGKRIMIPSGRHRALNIQLEPLH